MSVFPPRLWALKPQSRDDWTMKQLRLKEEVIRKDEMDGLMWEPSETDKKRKEEIEELKV